MCCLLLPSMHSVSTICRRMQLCHDQPSGTQLRTICPLQQLGKQSYPAPDTSAMICKQSAMLCNSRPQLQQVPAQSHVGATSAQAMSIRYGLVTDQSLPARVA